MSHTVAIPELPTHTIKHIDNWDGEGDLYITLAFMVGDDYYHYENGEPILEYMGDAILNIWELKENK
ncbi:MAG: hypothetical protein JKY81_05695 [Colwellia sp.]|nr:hypothetical protein [Colwellia sp.]